MAKQPTKSLACPILDLLTDEDIHRSLLRTVLVRQGVADPDAFLENNNVESQMVFRDVRVGDGTRMMASAVITKFTSKPQAPVPSDPQSEVK